MNKFLLSVLLLSSTLFADEMAEKIKAQNIEIIKMAVKEISSQLPQRVDDYTQIVDISSKEQTLIYTFEINTGAKSDEAVISEDKSRMKKAVTKGICISSDRFLQSGIDISYVYTSAKSKKELFRFDAKKKDCVNL